MKLSAKKLNFIYHNPNSDKELADLILKLFTEASKLKLENAFIENAKFQEVARCSEK